MVEKLILFGALGACGLIWLLAVQMRGMVVRALFMAAQDRYKDMAGPDMIAAAKLTAARRQPPETVETVAGVRDWLVETYPKAVVHLRIARWASLIAPATFIIIVAIWRIGFGGAL